MYISTATDNSITSFYGDFEFLSNFHPSALVVDGEFYSTIEHAFQAAKTDDPVLKKDIREATTPGEAKRKGRSVVLVPDWDLKKIDIMHSLVRQKFNAHIDLKIKLLMTGDRDLIEGNTWKDTFWGVTKDGVGENHLGKILVAVRDEIRKTEGSALEVLLKFLETRDLGFLNSDLRFLLSTAFEWVDSFDPDDHERVNECQAKFE